MPLSTWLDLFAAAVGGGFTVKVLDIGYQEFQRRSERKRKAQSFVDEHLDPLLKAADEVVGKIRSLAQRDFQSLRSLDGRVPAEDLGPGDLANLAYLVARFWARVEILRLESLYIALSKDRRGARLRSFLGCLESQRVRIVDRAQQRAIGEVMLDRTGGGSVGCASYVDFVGRYRTDGEFRRWIEPLVTVLARTRHTAERQRLLLYGVVLHALTDSLDPKHEVSRDRPSYANKLTRRTRRALRFRVFGLYLKFVKCSEKYFEPRRAQHRA